MIPKKHIWWNKNKFNFISFSLRRCTWLCKKIWPFTNKSPKGNVIKEQLASIRGSAHVPRVYFFAPRNSPREEWSVCRARYVRCPAYINRVRWIVHQDEFHLRAETFITCERKNFSRAMCWNLNLKYATGYIRSFVWAKEYIAWNLIKLARQTVMKYPRERAKVYSYVSERCRIMGTKLGRLKLKKSWNFRFKVRWMKECVHFVSNEHCSSQSFLYVCELQ